MCLEKRKNTGYLNREVCGFSLETGILHFFTDLKQDSRNNVSEIINLNGSKTTECKEIKIGAFQHFKRLLSKQEEVDNDLVMEMISNIPTLLSRMNNQELDKVIDEREVINANWNLEPDKAPGPDGFSISFYRKF